MLLKDYNILQIHIPKTGGNTVSANFHKIPYIEKLTWDHPCALKCLIRHYTPSHKIYSRIELQDFISDGILPFTTIRNPYDRAYSLFKWDQQNISKRERRESYSNFVYFLRALIKKEIKSNFWLPQSSWIYDREGLLPIKICKIENIREEIKPICRHAGFRMLDNSFKIKMNQNPLRRGESEYRKYYDEVSLRLVNRIYKKDIENFDYEF